MLAETNYAAEPASTSDRSSKSFRWETDLVSVLETRWRPWPGARQSTWLSVTEVRVGAASADLVFIRRQARRWPRVPAGLTPTEALCLAWLRDRRRTSIDWLERLCGVEAGALRDGTLDRLVDSGLLALGKGGEIVLRRDCSAGIQIVAVEAKLSKWKKALSQARSNMAFADQSYVALPSSRRSVLPAVAGAFQAAGVGLLFVADDVFDLAIPASSSARHTWRREYVYSTAYQQLREIP
jgi:hypothetical protein